MPTIEVPKINRGLGLEPSDRATSSSVQAGRRIAQQYNEAGAAYTELGRVADSAIERAGGAYVRFEESREISRGAVEVAKLQAQLTQDWNDRAKKADPNDPSVGPEFHEKTLNPALEEFQSAFTTEGGRKWAEQRIDHLRNHMFQKTSADMATMAGHAAVVNATQLVNAYSTTVKDDPSSLTSVMDAYKSSVSAVARASPNLTPEHAARMQEEVTQRGMETIVKSAVFGAIQKNPDEGMKLAQRTDLLPYLNGPEIKQFESYARSQKRMEEYERRNQRMAEKQEKEDKAEQAMGALLPRLYSDKPDVSREEINRLLNAGEITPRVYEHLSRIMEHASSEKLPPGVADKNALDLILDIQSGKITSTEPIYAAAAERKLDYPRLRQVLNEFRDFKADDGTDLGKVRNLFLRDYSRQVNPPDINNQHWYPEREFALYTAIRRQEQIAREKTGNPHEAYNPASPYFVGKQSEAQPLSPWQIKQDENRRSFERAAKVPPKPDWLGQFKNEATWDAQRGIWFVVRDGKKVPVTQ